MEQTVKTVSVTEFQQLLARAQARQQRDGSYRTASGLIIVARPTTAGTITLTVTKPCNC